MLGFILMGILITMSGILSSIDLANLNKDTAKELHEHEEFLTHSKRLLDVLAEKDRAFLNSIEDTLGVYDSIIMVSDSDFDKIILILKSKERGVGFLQRIEAANSRYNDILAKHDEITVEWLANVYSASYARVVSAVKDYLIFQQEDFQDYAEMLEQNVYRALMVGVISLAAGLLLLIALYYMIRSFFLSPVLKMEKALRDFLRANIPYSVKIETKDEISSLSEKIGEVCSKARKKEL